MDSYVIYKKKHEVYTQLLRIQVRIGVSVGSGLEISKSRQVRERVANEIT